MVWRLALLLFALLVTAAADGPPSEQQAVALLKAGQRQQALKVLDALLASKPADPSGALFLRGSLGLEDNDWRTVRPMVRQLVRLRPASLQAWELMVQVDQAAGDTLDRDGAIRSLYEAWHSALDPAIQSRVSFVRDRIFGATHVLLVRQTLDPGGDDSVRFVFQPVDEAGAIRHVILVQSDSETNMRWRDAGTVPFGTLVYHLDTVAGLANGQQDVRPYEYYLEPPDYDQVRAKVAEILAGTVKPLSGEADPYWTAGP
jgi:hypothetical protein